MFGPGRLRTLHTLLSLPLCADDCRSCAAVCRAGAVRGARRPTADGGRSPEVGCRSPLAAGCRSPLAAGCRSPLAAGCRSPLAAGCLSPDGCRKPDAAGFLRPAGAAAAAAGCLRPDPAGCRSAVPRSAAAGVGTGLSSAPPSAGTPLMGVMPILLLPLLPAERHGVEVTRRRTAAGCRGGAGSARSGVLVDSGSRDRDGDRGCDEGEMECDRAFKDAVRRRVTYRCRPNEVPDTRNEWECYRRV